MKFEAPPEAPGTSSHVASSASGLVLTPTLPPERGTGESRWSGKLALRSESAPCAPLPLSGAATTKEKSSLPSFLSTLHT